MAIRIVCARDAILFLSFGISVKMASIAVATNLWNVRCSDLSGKQSIKVDTFEPSVVFNVVSTVLQVTVSLR